MTDKRKSVHEIARDVLIEIAQDTCQAATARIEACKLLIEKCALLRLE